MFDWIRLILPRPLAVSRRRRTAQRRCFTHPHLEALEDRITPTTFNLTDTAGLQSAFSYAKSNPSDAVVINLSASGSYNLTAIGTQLVDQSTAGITINGNGATVTAASNNRVFEVDSGDNLSLNNLTVTGGGVNATTAKGGGIADFGGNLTLSAVKVTGNTAQSSHFAQGGGVYVSGGSLTIQNGCQIDNNYANGGSTSAPQQTANAYGGGIYVASGAVTITGSTVSNNIAKGGDATGLCPSTAGGSADKIGGGAQGGGLYVNNSSQSVTIKTSTFDDDSALGGDGAPKTEGTGPGRMGYGAGGTALGGGIYSTGTSLNLTATSLKGNTARGGDGGDGGNGRGGIGSGGGMYFNGTYAGSVTGDLNLDEGTFDTDSALGGGGAGGGASGGGLWVAAGGTNIQQTSFNDDRAFGGNVTKSKTNFTHGTSYGSASGGGIFTLDGSLTLTNCSVTNNLAVGLQAEGGGIVGSLEMINSTLGANTARGGNFGPYFVAGAEGGGLFEGGGSILINDTIAFNAAVLGSGGDTPSSALGGGIYSGSGNDTLTNVILEGNSAATGGSDYWSWLYGLNPNSGYDFISNTGGIPYNTSLSSLPGMILNNQTLQLGSLTVTSSGLAYYPILANSPVIDAGTENVVDTIAAAEGVSAADATDEIGNPLVSNNGIDMGAVQVVVSG